MKTCSTCANAKPADDEKMRKHSWLQCKLGKAWEYVSPQRKCLKWMEKK